MNAQDKPAFADLITQALAFYRQDVSVFSLGVWWQACQAFSLEQVQKAFTAHATDAERGRFPPMPADIVKHLQGTQTDRALMAWSKAYEAMQRVGAYQSVAFDDPAIHAAIEDLGGWTTLCRTTTDELPHLQRRFAEAHRAYSGRGTFAFPAYLIGESEAANRAAGKRTMPPVLIGDPVKASEVVGAGTSGARHQITSAADALKALGSTLRIEA